MKDRRNHPLLQTPADTAVDLNSAFFSATETTLLATKDVSASVFRYPSGVDAVRLSTPHGSMIMRERPASGFC